MRWLPTRISGIPPNACKKSSKRTSNDELRQFGVKKHIADGARTKCGICWIGYDPAEGDEATQIAAGMPFAGLPEKWRCRKCRCAQIEVHGD
ncbi:rubredoxin [Bradyrhizobium archetypum]|uniref:rubredoxin n=1 Tax=Bradyrhizobium archetypum TaxID=2721160 RepID=UPI0035E36663